MQAELTELLSLFECLDEQQKQELIDSAKGMLETQPDTA